MQGKRAVIFANGELPAPQAVLEWIDTDDLLIAADGGSRHAFSLGLKPQVIIGDLDSITAEAKMMAKQQGAGIMGYPRDKNETDLELALEYAIQQGCTSIRIIAALGGRLDQTLGNLALLTDPAWQYLDIRLDDGVEEAWFIRKHATIHGTAGDTVSLLPWGCTAVGVTTTGLKWALNGETLHPHKTRGISNEILAGTATVSIGSGLLLCVHRRSAR